MVGKAGRNVIFILSTPRAGSTLLGALLGNHSSVFCPPEPWLLLPLTAMRSNGVVILSSYDHELASVALQELADDEPFHSAAGAFAGTVYNTLLQRSKKGVFVDKTPRYYHILPFLEAVFPHAQKIWIKRNPLDVVASCKESWELTMAELMGEVISPFSFDATISHDLLASFFASRGPGKTEIRYEDLVQDPAFELRMLCERIGIRYEEQMVNYGANADLVRMYAASSMGDKKILSRQSPHMEAVNRWREVLVPEEMRQVLTTLGPNLFHRLGYGDVFGEAAALIGMDTTHVNKEGRMPALLERYASYAETGLGDLAVVQNTLIARQARELRARFAESEADRASRLLVIERQGEEIAGLAAEVHRALEEGKALGEWVTRVTGERDALEVELADLRPQFEAVEADWAARLQVIERQSEEITGLAAEVHRALEESKTLGERVTRVTTERDALQVELADLRRQFEVVEADRAARLQVIERQGEEIAQLQRTIETLAAQLKESDAHRSTQAAVVEMQEEQIRIIMAQMRALQRVINTLQHTRAYRLLRWLGRWKFISEITTDSPQRAALDSADARHRRAAAESIQGRAHTGAIPPTEGEIRALLAELEAMQEVVKTVRRARVYRLLRRLGRWKFMEAVLVESPAARDGPAAHGPRILPPAPPSPRTPGSSC